MLNILARHAFLNLLRNKRRTLTLAALLVSSFVILFLTKCFLEGMYWGLRLGFVGRCGNVEVAARGYWADSAESKPIMDSALEREVLGRIAGLRALPIRSVESEMAYDGLVGTERSSTVITGTGARIDAAGGSNAGVSLTMGRPLFEGDDDAIVLGKRAAEKIGVTVGESVTLFTQTAEGAFNPVGYRVVGLATTGNYEADLFFSALSLEAARNLKQARGADRVLVFLTEDAAEAPALAALDSALRDLPVETRTWEELSPFYFGLKGFYDAIFGFMIAVVAGLVAIAIFELVSMSFYERFRELGTLRAMGNTKSEIFLILFCETLLLYALCVACGMAAGWGLGALLNFLDLHWTPPGGTNAVPAKFYLKAAYFALPSLVILLASFLASLLPAWTASRKEVVEVLKYE